jgi:hypothetical protein
MSWVNRSSAAPTAFSSIDEPGLISSDWPCNAHALRGELRAELEWRRWQFTLGGQAIVALGDGAVVLGPNWR